MNKRNLNCTCNICTCGHEHRGKALGIAIVVAIIWLLVYVVGDKNGCR